VPGPQEVNLPEVKLGWQRICDVFCEPRYDGQLNFQRSY